jgi:hypothetical protein
MESYNECWLRQIRMIGEVHGEDDKDGPPEGVVWVAPTSL